MKNLTTILTILLIGFITNLYAQSRGEKFFAPLHFQERNDEGLSFFKKGGIADRKKNPAIQTTKLIALYDSVYEWILDTLSNGWPTQISVVK